MTDRPTRRRFLSIAAIALAMPGADALALTGGAPLTLPPTARWRGTALGAETSMLIAGMDDARARPVFARMTAEIDRLENIFSLYRPQSSLARLNRDGRLDGPPLELLELLSLCGAVHAATKGAFDPTVQPLWTLYAECAARGRAPSNAEVTNAMVGVGWAHLRFGPDAITFARPDMALTLNGAAQGFIADRVADLMRTEGLRNVLIDMGEIRALGHRPDGGAWRVGIADPDGALRPETPALSDRALATSASLAGPFDPTGREGHIFDPRTGRPGGVWHLVSVSAEHAALADALSTGLCLTPPQDLRTVLRAAPGAQIEALS